MKDNKEEKISEQEASEAQLDANTNEEAPKEEKTFEELLKEEKDKYLRLYAEFDNFKKRSTKERIDLYKTAGKELMLELLPVLDDVSRAYDEIKKNKNKELLKGVELIKNKLFKTLENNGLEAIPVAAGDDLDTDKHEAITQIPVKKEELKNKIVDCIETGYTLNDKVIRFAKVVVGQ